MKEIMSKKETEMSGKEFVIYNITVACMIFAAIFVVHGLATYFFTHTFDINVNIAYTLVRGTVFSALAIIANCIKRAIGPRERVDAE